MLGCHKRAGWDKVSLYHILAIMHHQGKKTAALSSKRCHDWVVKINRKEWSPTKNARVCPDYFVSGKMWSLLCTHSWMYLLTLPVCYEGKLAMLEDTNTPDWVPSLRMGYCVVNSGGSLEWYTCLQARCIKRRWIDNSWCESETTGHESNVTRCESGMSYLYK